MTKKNIKCCSRLQKQYWMSKSLIKQLKQYALDHDTTLTAIAVEAFQEFLHRKKKDKQKLLLASNLGV